MTSSPSVHAIVDSPVLALEGNILWQFENLSEFGAQTLKMQVAHGTLSGEIALDMSAAPPEAPGVTRQGEGVPEMHVKLSHLEILWAFIYGWMVVYEESVQKPQLDPTKVMNAETVNLVDRARKLLEWSASLRETYTPWPAGLPSPRRYATEQEEWYGLKANLVYQKAVAYLLSHERAHAALGHLDVMESADGARLKLDMEKEADAAAYDDLLGQSLDDREKLPESWAVLSVMLSTFYLYRDPRIALLPGGHPALHHRVAHMIERLALTDPGYDYYFTFLCRLVLQEVFPEVLEPKRQFDDWEDALTDALDRLDQLGFEP
ncbi:MAG: phage exclusion protein Lit family protein [Limnohabitans sp.]